MKKRFVSFMLACIMLLPILPNAFAANRTAAQAANTLYALGLMKGTSYNADGSPIFELDRAATRAEAVTMLVRLLGKEQQALSENHSTAFTDVASWAQPYVGYAYANGLTNGMSDTTFGSNSLVTAAQYLTFVLRALGYRDSAGDFTVATAAAKADSISLTNGEYIAATSFTRGDAAKISCQALFCSLKSTDTTLLSTLVSAGAVLNTAVVAAELTDALTAGNAHSQLITTNTSGEAASTTNTPATNTTETPSTRSELSAEQIYAQCSPAVFYIEIYDAYNRAAGSGSGFFINSNGMAITNYHVIQGASSATITTADDKKYTVEGIYDYDAARDLALLKIAGTGFPYLTAGNTSTVVGGATVYAIGSPLGLSNTITQGIISNVNRVIDGQSYIQTSAAISSGSSGGALLNKYGQVVGVTSGTLTSSSSTNTSQNLNLAIPYSAVSALSTSSVNALAAHGNTNNTNTTKKPTTSYPSFSLASGVPDLGQIFDLQPLYTDTTYDSQTGYLCSYAYASKSVSSTTLQSYYNILDECGIQYVSRFTDDYGYPVMAFMSNEYIVFIGGNVVYGEPVYVVEVHEYE